MEAWVRNRLRPEMLLDAGDPEWARQGAASLVAMMPDLPSPHRAEVAFNLGVLHWRLGLAGEAVQYIRMAREQNPALAPVDTALLALSELVR
jgi:hypothetical protein